MEQFLRDKHIGPLDGFRSKAGWPFVAEMVIKFDEEAKNYKLEFDFGDDKAGEEDGEIIDFSAQTALGVCPKCGGNVFEHGKNYVCEKSVPTDAQATPSCDFKSGQIILQQPIEREQMQKLLATGKTDMLDDLTRVFSVLDGKPEPDFRRGWYGRISDCRTTSDPDAEDAYMSIRSFRNGNGHVTFKRPDLVDKMNLIIAKHYPGALPAPK